MFWHPPAASVTSVIVGGRTTFSKPKFDEFIDVDRQTWTVLLLRNFDALYDQVLDTSRGWFEVASPSYGLLGDISFLIRALLFALTPVRKRSWRLIAWPTTGA